MTDKTSERRRHSAALKKQILDECNQPGASIAAVAMAHGINANLVHKWRSRTPMRIVPTTLPGGGEFIPVPLIPTAVPSILADIRMELCRGSVTVTLSWPMSAATECAHWLREVLR